MATTQKPKQRRKPSRGFTHAAGLMGGNIRKVTAARGFSEARLLTTWAEVVGPNLAKITRPTKVSFAKNGLGATLLIVTEGAHAPEVQMQEPDIVARVNACYGYKAISRIRITQTDRHGLGLAEAAQEFVDDREIAADPEKISKLGLDNVKDEGLRAALESLSNSVLTRSK